MKCCLNQFIFTILLISTKVIVNKSGIIFLLTWFSGRVRLLSSGFNKYVTNIIHMSRFETKMGDEMKFQKSKICCDSISSLILTQFQKYRYV